jgi:hypothetical protein
MQAERVQVLAQQAAAGNPEAFLALVQEFALDLRLALAVHLDQPSALATVEPAVWAAVRARLGEFIGDPPFPSWIQQVAVEPVAAHLAQADRRAIEHQDALSHQIIERCREALADGAELGVADIHARFTALPEATRALLQRRYRDRQRSADIAASQMISEVELAISLAAARAVCDWRGQAKPPAAGDRLLPALIEDWLGNTIDVDSRALLATNLGRDAERAAQFVRQVRVHLALSALFAPFTRDDAVALVRQAGLGAGDNGRVMIGESPRPAAARQGSSEARRPARMNTSNRQAVPILDAAERPSPVPWLIGGAMVLLGALALLVTSLGGGSARPSPVTPAEKPAVVTPPTHSGDGGVSRPLPNLPSEPRVKIVGLPADIRLYSNQPLELRALVSGAPDATEVEYWVDEQRIGAARDIPYGVVWKPTRAGTVSVTARVLFGATVKATSEPISIPVSVSYGSGEITREWWNGLGGDEIAPALAALTSTTPPAGRMTESRFESPRNREDSYLQRMSGFLIPPLDGEYVFWIGADNEGELWLSPDDNREHRVRIAIAPYIPGGAVPYDAWDHDTRQRSQPIRLRAGQRYYCEALHKEGGGNDHVQVGWRLPDGRLERPIPGVHLSPAPPAPTPTGSVPSAPAAVPGVADPADGPVMVLWDGETRAGGSGYASSGITPVAGSGRGGGTGLQAVMTTDFANIGWNWCGWFPDDGGTDVRVGNALGFWIRVHGPNRPTAATVRFLCGPKDRQPHSAEVSITELAPTFADGEWHHITIPFARLAADGFDLAKVWEFNLKLHGQGRLVATVAVDDVAVLRLPVTPVAASPSVAPAPAAAPAATAWMVVRAINLGGEATESDGVRFQAHRLAEAEGATPAGSHQPGPWLSDLNWQRGSTGTGDIKRDATMSGVPIKLDGKAYAKGLGVHAMSELVYALDGRYSGFTAVAGLDDVAQVGEVIFQVWLDGQKVWDSGVVRKGMPKAVAVPLVGRKELRLVVDPNGPTDWDHADWANARFLIPGGDDGVLQVRAGRRTTATFTPKPAVDSKTRALLTTALAATKEGLAFRVEVPNGPSRVWLWVAEHGAANSRQSDLTVEGVTLPGVGALPAGTWEKLGPVEVDVADGTIDVAATVLKGTPQVMGILVEQAPTASSSATTPVP